MNLGDAVLRFLFLVGLCAVLAACRQLPELPELDLPEAIQPRVTPSSEPTQPPPVSDSAATATPPAATPEPALTVAPSPDTPALFEEKMQEGVDYAEQAKWEKAIEAFQDALAIDPESGRAHSNIGIARQHLGEFNEAIEEFDKAIELDPENAEYCMNRGNALKDAGDLEAAVESYTQAIDLDPSNPDFFYNRAIAYKLQDEYEQAIADYDQAILLDPAFAYAYHNRANVYWILGDLDKALADFDQGLALDPDDGLGYLNRGTLQEEMGHLKQAAADLDQAIALLQPDIITASGSTFYSMYVNTEDGGENRSEEWIRALIKRAHVNHELGDCDLANSDVEMAVRSNTALAFDIVDDDLAGNPHRSISLYGRGLAHEYQEEDELAIADYTQAIKNNGSGPMLQYYHLRRGLLYARNEAIRQAIADWEKALRIDPDNFDAHYFLGMAYRDVGDFERSLTKLVTGLESSPPPDILENYGYAATESDQPSSIPENYALEIMYSADLLAANSANQEQIEAVIDAFDGVQSQIPDYEITGPQWNNLCWYATVWGLAEDVLFACELAVEKEPEIGSTHDSRGLARAVTGDFAGAIEDFQYYIAWGVENDEPSESINLRESWIASLEAGENPFDEGALERLREGVSWTPTDTIPQEDGEDESTPASEQADDSPNLPQGHIAFQSATEESWGIQSVNLQTGEVDILTYHPVAHDEMPKFSPNGDQLLFTTYADPVSPEIYLLRSDGTFIRLTENAAMDAHAVWSPDGKEIAFSSDAAGNFDVYLMDLESGDSNQLTRYEGLDWFPSWSPDGQQIVFESDRDGNYELYLMDRDGSNVVRLTENEAIDSSPAWSPDGQKIAFNSDRSGAFQVHLLDLATGETIQLTEGRQQASHPEWSPDGQFIAFDAVVDETSDIYVMKADGSEQRRVTNNPADERYPSWVEQRVEFAEKPFWHKPVCMRDTDGDREPDTVSESWTVDDEIGYVLLPFRNMEDMKPYSLIWTHLDTGFTDIDSTLWYWGEAGAIAENSPIKEQGPGVWEIELSLEGELIHVIQCPVVE